MNGLVLRDLALDALSPHDPAAAFEVLGRADVVLLPEGQMWTSSEGKVQGQAVLVSVDARTLGELRASPSVADAIQRAVAHVVGSQSDQALAELTWTWSGTLRSTVEHYRGSGARVAPVGGHAALLDWLEGAEERVAAEVIRASTVTDDGADVSIASRTAPTPQVRGAVGDALCALRGPTARAQWHKVR